MDMNIKSNDDLLSLFEDKDKFNNFLVLFAEKIKQDILLSLPDIVIKHIQDQHKYKKLVDNFYKENPELKKEKPLIMQLINKVAADNPGMALKDMFNLTAKKAQQILGGQDE